MKVFIGWSGQRSQAMAVALRDWLPLVLHYAEPWLSETDIAAGERWADAIAKELEASNFGIICVSRENLTSPWILFEAGSLSKSLSSSRVIPLLLDLEFTEISGPLAQFQAKKVDEDGVGEAIQSINRAAQQPIQDSRATQLFEALWPDLHKKLEGIPAPKEATKPIRSQHQVLEELVASVRSLEGKQGSCRDRVKPARSSPSPFWPHDAPDDAGRYDGRQARRPYSFLFFSWCLQASAARRSPGSTNSPWKPTRPRGRAAPQRQRRHVSDFDGPLVSSSRAARFSRSSAGIPACCTCSPVNSIMSRRLSHPMKRNLNRSLVVRRSPRNREISGAF